jgi:hypothetical protein
MGRDENCTPYGVVPKPLVKLKNQAESQISLESSDLYFPKKIRKQVADDICTAALEP